MGRRRVALILLLAVPAAHAGASGELRICADPNNLPFSNAQREGFENVLAERLAADLGLRPTYVWWAQRRGNVRQTLNAGLCDVIPGVASGLEMLATTRPYYRSTYVFVTPAGRHVASLDDPALRQWTIGVQMVGDDGANTPPAHALARRGIIGNVRGFPLYGDYRRPNPPAAIIDAVAGGRIDVALAWGPMAGYFAARQTPALEVAPVRPWLDGPQWPMVFDISMGVRKDDVALRRRLDDALDKERPFIDALLERYHVPRVDMPEPQGGGSRMSMTGHGALPQR
jgi:mxaJ protein